MLGAGIMTEIGYSHLLPVLVSNIIELVKTSGIVLGTLTIIDVAVIIVGLRDAGLSLNQILQTSDRPSPITATVLPIDTSVRSISPFKGSQGFTNLTTGTTSESADF
jgi:hypothetical protein